MKYLLTLFIVLSQFLLMAQNSEDLNKLIQRKKELQRSITYYQKELQEVESKIVKLQTSHSQPIIVTESGHKIIATTGENGATLRMSPSVQGAEIMSIPANTTIYVHHEHNGMYFKTTYYGKEGWVNYTNIESQPEIDAMIQTPKNINTSTRVVTVDEKDPKYQRLSKIYGKEKAIKIINKTLWKGMSHGQVKESLGKPISSTKKNTPKGLEEEWSYSGQKLIFLNGTLLTW